MKQSLALLKQLEDEIAALPSASTIKKPMISEAAEESQILEELKREYYGVEIKFSETEFYVVDSYQLLEACQGTLLLTDMFRPKLEFYQADYPIKNMSIIDWLDLHVIFTSANEGEKTGAKKLPAIILDCGGRKIRLPVGGNRYSYDMGKLPSYELKYIQGKAHIYTDTTNQENVEVLRNINKFGKDPLEQSLKYISYPDIIKQMKKHYGDYYSSTSIAKEIRRLLKGAPLSDGHSPYLPVLTCALFASEVARNPICMVSGLMLLDLIEIQAKTPNGTDYFRWDNVLESPAFHPMVHHGSWSDEFKKGKYYIEKPLNLSHIKSFIILAEWAKRYFSTMKISVLNEETYKARYSKGLQAHIDYYSQYGRKHEKMWQYEYQRCTSGAIASFFTSINASLNARFQDIRNPLKPENNFPFDRLFPSSLGSVSNSNGQNAVAGLSTANEVDEKSSREVTIYTRQANSSLTLPQATLKTLFISIPQTSEPRASLVPELKKDSPPLIRKAAKTRALFKAIDMNDIETVKASIKMLNLQDQNVQDPDSERMLCEVLLNSANQEMKNAICEAIATNQGIQRAESEEDDEILIKQTDPKNAHGYNSPWEDGAEENEAAWEDEAPEHTQDQVHVLQSLQSQLRSQSQASGMPTETTSTLTFTAIQASSVCEADIATVSTSTEKPKPAFENGASNV